MSRLPIAVIARDPALRLTAVLVFLVGSWAGTFAPYFSLLAVQVFDLGDRGYAAVLLAASVIGVAASLAAGIVTDQRANRRNVAVVTSALILAGSAGVFLIPHPAVFILAHAIVIPIGMSLFGQVFALGRLAASHHPVAERDGILTTIRAGFALPFILILPLVSLALHLGMEVIQIYGLLAAISLTTFAVTLAFWPRDGASGWQDRRSGLSFLGALREIAHPSVASRVVLIGAINGASVLYMAITGLIFTTYAGRPEGDVALFVGFVAGLEVPFMVAAPILLRHLTKSNLIAFGAFVYAVHLSLIAPLSPTPLVWILVLPAAAGGAIFLSLPIAYLQDLMADRPGTGSSLLAVQKIFADGFAAVAFVAGTTIAGYGTAALIGAGFAVIAGVVLIWIDRAPHQPATSARIT